MRSMLVSVLIILCFLSVAGLTYGFGLSSKEIINYTANLDSSERKEKYLRNQMAVFTKEGKLEEASLLFQYLENNFNTLNTEDIKAQLHLQESDIKAGPLVKNEKTANFTGR